MRLRRIKRTEEAAKRIKEELNNRWENAVALKESGKLKDSSRPSAWDRERKRYHMSARVNSFMHRGGGDLEKSCHLAERKNEVVNTGKHVRNPAFRERVRGEPSESRWARAKREAEARKKKEDEDLLQEELDRQRRLVQQLKKKNQEKSNIKNRLSSNISVDADDKTGRKGSLEASKPMERGHDAVPKNNNIEEIKLSEERRERKCETSPQVWKKAEP